MQGMVVVGLIVEESNIGLGHRVKVPAKPVQ